MLHSFPTRRSSDLGEEERLDGDQHEKRLEASLHIREVTPPAGVGAQPFGAMPGHRLLVLAGTRSDSWRLVERPGFGVRCRWAAIIFSFVIGIASTKVCIGVLPKHQRP